MGKVNDPFLTPDFGLLGCFGDVLYASCVLLLLYPFIYYRLLYKFKGYGNKMLSVLQIIVTVSGLIFLLIMIFAQQMHVTYQTLFRPVLRNIKADRGEAWETAHTVVKFMFVAFMIFNYYLIEAMNRATEATINYISDAAKSKGACGFNEKKEKLR